MTRQAQLVALAHGALVAALIADAALRKAPCLGDFATGDCHSSLTAVPELVLAILALAALVSWWRTGKRNDLVLVDSAALLVALRYGPRDPLAITITLAALIGIGLLLRESRQRQERRNPLAE